MLAWKNEAFLEVMKNDYILVIVSKILGSAGLFAECKRQKSSVDFKTHML